LDLNDNGFLSTLYLSEKKYRTNNSLGFDTSRFNVDLLSTLYKSSQSKIDADVILQLRHNGNNTGIFWYEEISEQIDHICNYLMSEGYRLKSTSYRTGMFGTESAIIENNKPKTMDGEKIIRFILFSWEKLTPMDKIDKVLESDTWPYNEEIVQTLRDILLDIEDDGFTTKVDDFNHQLITVDISKKESFHYTEIDDIVKRMDKYMKTEGFSYKIGLPWKVRQNKIKINFTNDDRQHPIKESISSEQIQEEIKDILVDISDQGFDVSVSGQRSSFTREEQLSHSRFKNYIIINIQGEKTFIPDDEFDNSLKHLVSYIENMGYDATYHVYGWTGHDKQYFSSFNFIKAIDEKRALHRIKIIFQDSEFLEESKEAANDQLEFEIGDIVRVNNQFWEGPGQVMDIEVGIDTAGSPHNEIEVYYYLVRNPETEEIERFRSYKLELVQ
jgi:uncharacterized protein (UPF0335 family)